MYPKLARLCSSLFLLTVLIGTSCQKELSFSNNNTRVTTYDSALLIKSITYVYAGQDSTIEHYSYDTIGRKITLTWDDQNDNYVPDGTIAEFSYNNDDLLSHVAYTYPAGYTPQASDYLTFDISYDAQKVLQKITQKWGNGTILTRDYAKTLIAGGSYQLDWDETDPSTPDQRSSRRVVFDVARKPAISIHEESFVVDFTPAGDPVYTNYITTDSFFYDAAGSLARSTQRRVDTFAHTSVSGTYYEYLNRQSRGTQLYDQRQTLLSGIANIPFDDPDSFNDGFGVLSNGIDMEYVQYSKYPYQMAKITNWNGNNYTYNAVSVFDSQNRLVRFKGFFLDVALFDIEYRIKYYK